MRKLIRFLVVSALVLFVGIPLAFAAMVLGLTALGIAAGIGGAILGLLFTVVKVALMVILPVALLWWLATRMFSRERSW